MSITQKIAQNTAAQIIGKILSTGLGLIAIGMMTRYLGQEKFGWYVTAISFLQFVGILIDFGLIPVTAQMLSEPIYEKTLLLKNLMAFRLVTAVIFFGIALIIAIFLPYPPQIKIAIIISTISFLSTAMNQILTGYYQVELRTHIQALSDIIGRFVLVIGLFFLIMLRASFVPIIIAIVMATATQTAILWRIAAKKISLGFAFDFEIWRAISIKMWPIAISIIFNVVYLRGDIIILSFFRSQSDVGLYGAAYRVLDILSQFGMMMMGVMLPLLAYNFSRNLKEEFRARYQQSFDALMLFAIPMMAGALILGKKIMTFVAGPDFAEAGHILELLSIAVFGVYLGAVFGHVALAINRQKETMWIYISDAVITIFGYIIFIPIYGMAGAAWMTVFSELYAGILLFFVVRHYSGERLRFKTFGKISLASLAMFVVILLLKNLHITLLIPIGMLIYSAILIGIRGISIKTIKEIVNV